MANKLPQVVVQGLLQCCNILKVLIFSEPVTYLILWHHSEN